MSSYAPPPSAPSGLPQPEPRTSNGLATAGFVVALVGALLAFIPAIGLVSWACRSA